MENRMNTDRTINEQIAGALGDAAGSYEQLIGRHICDALGIEPTFRGRLMATRKISPQAAAWLRDASGATNSDAAHASEILDALELIDTPPAGGRAVA
jgi:hypothetical protein